ncbi:hypothetical protein FRZ61_45600 [Hypericibacter adhaerens]|jgi:hypothetical protein|uniref:Methane oxygenase PmoA n=1 Tax=Hypericibacter adhaerens TaxID=2602016 RepID=A0A5J6N460_9PROT|nr:DUF6807 family protein [Hypericibacter adhaerens]QEX24619.1 hypothetical protein FRZ61_45600 [Hypericibacter adhaerens]
MTDRFILADDPIALPQGAWAKTERRTLRRGNLPVLSLTQGHHRPYLFPVYTPQGFAVTSECPADHPHHNSCWIASDHVDCWMPAADGRKEQYTYNFYVNETFQGRAPGRILQTQAMGEETAAGYRITQEMEWRGPVEWAAPEGRLAARERRRLDLKLEGGAYVIDVESALSAAAWDLSLGPTRHAYFNLRVAESIAVTSGGRVVNDRGASGGAAVSGAGAHWVHYCGPVGGGHWAGLALFPDPRDHRDPWWFVADWGVVTVGPFRLEKRDIRQGETMTLRYRVLLHDGDLPAAVIAERYAAYLAGLR